MRRLEMASFEDLQRSYDNQGPEDYEYQGLPENDYAEGDFDEQE